MYESYYDLTGKPFQLSPDSRFFFNSSGHNRAMAYLRYGLRQGEGFIVITGGIGTGKSMLVANLFSEITDDNLVAAQLVSTQVGEDDVLRMVNAAYGLAHETLSKTALLKNLESFFRARRAEGKCVLLVVDEAQNLPRRSIEELRMLSNYQQDGEALLQSFLIGQAELRQTLQSTGMEQVRQRIIAGYHLRPLSRDEVQAYIEHRLHLVNWSGHPRIQNEAYDRIYQASGGVPRRVNTLVDRVLLFGALEELQVITAEHINTVFAEIEQEVGHSTPLTVQESGVAPTDLHEGDLVSRIQALESQLLQLREAFEDDRELRRQAMLTQLGIESDE